ncbi:MAG: F0F1 ATP synthase subunit epsilon [Alphaproteobacteria bacterium]
MAEGKVEFELVSPERLLLSRDVDMVVVPGTEGNFGVLPRHAPMISTIRPGVIDVYEGKTIVERIFVAGGVAEVTPQRCTVLAEQAMPVGEIDRAAVERRLADLREDIRDAKDELARKAYEAEAAIAEAMLKAVA